MDDADGSTSLGWDYTGLVICDSNWDGYTTIASYCSVYAAVGSTLLAD